jgi:hypothetical protein
MTKYEPERTWNALETTETEFMSIRSEIFSKRGRTLESLVSTRRTVLVGVQRKCQLDIARVSVVRRASVKNGDSPYDTPSSRPPRRNLS